MRSASDAVVDCRRGRAIAAPLAWARAALASALAVSFMVASNPLADDALADDVVHLRREDSEHGLSRLVGEVVDLTGEELQLRRAGGVRKYPAAHIVRIETAQTDAESAAIAAFRKGEFERAALGYRDAVRAEARSWNKRRLFGRMALCYRYLGQFELAGDATLLVLRDDPSAPELAVLPLAWKPQQPQGTLAAKAAEWLADDDAPAQLLGASWLLSAAQRPAAIAALRKLAAGDDARVALLAEFLLWQTEPAAALQQTRAMQLRAANLPFALRAGPNLVIGRAFARLGDHESAALVLLQAPLGRAPSLGSAETQAIVVAGDIPRDLLADALVLAGENLLAAGRIADAKTLLREAASDYVPFPAAAAAAKQLERLAPSAAP